MGFNEPSDRDSRGGSVIIDCVHDHIHVGNSWHYPFYATAPDDGPTGILIDLTNATKEAHITFAPISVGGDMRIELWENTTHSNGTLQTPQNRHRVKADAGLYPDFPPNEAEIWVPVFDGADGSPMLTQIFVPGGALLITQGGASSESNEWVLRPGVKYLVKVTNLAGNPQPVSIGINWYEVD